MLVSFVVTEMLSDLEVLVIDCQATMAAPRGHLVEIGWARLGKTAKTARHCLIKLPDDHRVPPVVARITGISTPDLRDGIDAHAAWRQLLDDARGLTPQPARTIIHFARFERPFLSALAEGAPPLDIMCTHEIARRLLPTLPRRSLRALTGYFGRDVGPLRRSASHVEATAFVWQELIPLLLAEGISTWGALGEWLAASVDRGTHRRAWPLPREVRLSAPDAPGVYRMHRKGGAVLYVGKASSLHHRVNSHFQKQAGIPERVLEMLSQVRAMSFEVCPTALEAALLEPDEIKRLRPLYNVALAEGERAVHFAAPNLSEHSIHLSPRCPLGPFPSLEVLEQFAALGGAGRAALGRGSRHPAPEVFSAGVARFCDAHGGFALDGLTAHARLLRLGTRLWREECRDRAGDEQGWELTPPEVPEWTPERVQIALEWVALSAALARRRAKWLTRLVDTTVVWTEPGRSGGRFLVIENGEIVERGDVDCGASPPVPPGWARSTLARREAFTTARFDRLRVLTTELKRLTAAGASVAVRFGPGRALADERLARALSWV